MEDRAEAKARAWDGLAFHFAGIDILSTPADQIDACTHEIVQCIQDRFAQRELNIKVQMADRSG
jgi:hypothetical protein